MAAKLSEMANALESHEDSSLRGEANIWSAADKGDTAKLKELLDKGKSFSEALILASTNPQYEKKKCSLNYEFSK